MTNLLHDIPTGTVDNVNVIIEIPKGSSNKYELDKKTNMIKFDRALYTGFVYPADYGFIPQTHCEDGDPLDAFVLVSSPLIPGCLIEARPVALINMIDSGERDSKIICVATEDPNFSHIRDKSDLNPHFLKVVQHFFEHYKDLQNKEVTIEGIEDVDAAKKEIQRSIDLYNEMKTDRPQ